MARRRVKKGEPEMLIVSFCDIVTITTAAMFFAMLITIQEAVKVPVFTRTPRAIPSNKTSSGVSLPSARQAIFFECHGEEVFYVDKDALDVQVQDFMNAAGSGARSGDIAGFLKSIQGQEVGNQYYKVNPNYLLTGIMALELRPNIHGENSARIETAGSQFQGELAQLDNKSQYIVFLVRNDSFDVFRLARSIADKWGLDTGWELLDAEEPIKFGAAGTPVLAQ